MAKKKKTTKARRPAEASQPSESEQLAAWKAAIAAAERKKSTGELFQRTGLATLEKIKAKKQLAKPADIAKLMAEATRTIEKGAKMECAAVEQLLDLQRNRPRVNSDGSP